MLTIEVFIESNLIREIELPTSKSIIDKFLEKLYSDSFRGDKNDLNEYVDYIAFRAYSVIYKGEVYHYDLHKMNTILMTISSDQGLVEIFNKFKIDRDLDDLLQISEFSFLGKMIEDALYEFTNGDLDICDDFKEYFDYQRCLDDFMFEGYYEKTSQGYYYFAY